MLLFLSATGIPPSYFRKRPPTPQRVIIVETEEEAEEIIAILSLIQAHNYASLQVDTENN